ncbi:menaquinone-dependent protoporphyrinogen IX dehydrogenase [Jeongeupia naejangsanensis]|uniref:Protoporphyrinogen IX dehydrogenase [quinone] n=1 Tax=Jeongeupia naejangsanensis TaxID=613195 RepID=A0ABS2BL47_9NEIS|nr:menaquinone-dependent protoporphyrinogen IX dehydrogenase [Jeongeupia naejangsanensis]MBM3116340.1 menaquinone-dependent protoporphyrinogen IX dehydrogenase [Jeongeupia naejangsanensis]
MIERKEHPHTAAYAVCMDTLLICHASRDGQATRIAERLARHRCGDAVVLCDLTRKMPDTALIAAADAIVVVAAVRYGNHLPEAERFMLAQREILQCKPVAIASVNLSARKPGKASPERNAYLRRWLAKHKLKPALATAFAGRLDYPRYRWFDRLMIRLIMAMSDGPTDPGTVVEYTDWEAVDDFAEAIGRLCR